MSEVYVLVHEDTHFGVAVDVFDDEAFAVRSADTLARSYLRDGDELEDKLNPAMAREGIVYSVSLPETGDVSVVRKNVFNA